MEWGLARQPSQLSCQPLAGSARGLGAPIGSPVKTIFFYFTSLNLVLEKFSLGGGAARPRGRREGMVI